MVDGNGVMVRTDDAILIFPSNENALTHAPARNRSLPRPALSHDELRLRVDEHDCQARAGARKGALC